MNATHLHLLITHLPIVGSILGSLVLIHGVWSKSEQTKIAAYNVLILSAIGAVIAYVTGEGAEETIENIQGISKAALEDHEDFANFTLAALIAMGVISLFGLFLSIRKSSISGTVAVVTLIVALSAFGMVARTGYQGGQIRHTEIVAGNANTVNQGLEQNEDD